MIMKILIMIIPLSMILFSFFYDEKNIKFRSNNIRYSDKIRKRNYRNQVAKQDKKALLVGGIILLIINIVVILRESLNVKNMIMILVIQVLAYSIIVYVPYLVLMKKGN